IEADEAADHAVRPGAGDRPGRRRIGDDTEPAREAQRADEAAQHAVAAAGDRALRRAETDDAVAGADQAAGDAAAADADVAGRPAGAPAAPAADVAVRPRGREGRQVEVLLPVADETAVANAVGGRVRGDQPAGDAAVTGLHIAAGGGQDDGAGIAADEPAGLQIGDVGAADIGARLRIADQPLIVADEPAQRGAAALAVRAVGAGAGRAGDVAARRRPVDDAGVEAGESAAGGVRSDADGPLRVEAGLDLAEVLSDQAAGGDVLACTAVDAIRAVLHDAGGRGHVAGGMGVGNA